MKLKNVNTIINTLGELYGMPQIQPHGDALSELIMTVLSQNTSDKNSGRAFIQLLRNFKDWNSILKIISHNLFPLLVMLQKAFQIFSSQAYIGFHFNTVDM